MTLIFAAQDRAAFASGDSILTANGRAVAGAWSEPQVVVPLPASGGLCWCVQLKPNDTWCGAVLPAHCVRAAPHAANMNMKETRRPSLKTDDSEGLM